MTKIAKRTGILLAPLAAILVTVVAIYGPAGPADDRQVYSLAQLIGVVYGVYATVLIISWLKSARSK
jgi:hypothetical protein